MKLNKLITSTLVATCMISTMSFAQNKPTKNNTHMFNKKQTQAIQGIIHDYLVTNPQVLIEASAALQKQRFEKTEATALAAIKANKAQLFEDAHSPMAGNPKGSVILVEFYDYQCGHCKTMKKTIDTLIKKNPNLKVIFKDFPIFGANSEYAAKASLAAYKIDANKYLHFHDSLLGENDPLSKDVVNQLAKKSGYNLEMLTKTMMDDTITQQIKANLTLARALKLQGTPALIFANSKLTKFKFFPGAAPAEQAQAMMNAVQGDK